MTCAKCGKSAVAFDGYNRLNNGKFDELCRPCWVQNGAGNTYGNEPLWVHEGDGTWRSLPLSGLGEVGRG